jgi:predicted flap endonuclease-1-like 5' DNA nuclease
MIYLIGEMLVLLLIAAAIGFIAAWVLRGMGHARADDDRTAAVWSLRLSAAEAEYEAKSTAAEAANARLKADLHAAETRAGSLENDGGKRVADIEAVLRAQIRAAEALAHERTNALEQLRTAFTTANNESRARIAAADAEAHRLAAELEIAVQEAERVRAEQARLADMETDLHARQDTVEALQRRILELESAVQTAATTTRRTKAGLAPGEDDLTIIPGLGPVMAKALRAHGIVTFRALATMTQDEAQALGLQMGNTFAERARREDWFGKARALIEPQGGDAS